MIAASIGVLAAPRIATAQHMTRERAAMTLMDAAATTDQPHTDTALALFRPLSRLPHWSAPIASALVPGIGQARLGQERSVAYLALEVYLVLQYVKNENEGRGNEVNFRSIARDVARRGFPGTHPDTVWQYYEKMEKFDASGVFTLAASGPTIPESDPKTYNGQQWIFARQVHGIPVEDPNPSGRANYAQALALYESRAIPLAYGWNWVNASFEKDIFVRTIAQSNDAYRRGSYHLIVLIANHIISSIDAFSSVRLMQSNGMLRATATIPLR